MTHVPVIMLYVNIEGPDVCSLLGAAIWENVPSDMCDQWRLKPFSLIKVFVDMIGSGQP